MRWFKHYSDMHQGRSINHLLDELGHTGLCFFLLQEMCAEKLDVRAESSDKSPTTFHFHQRIVRQNLRISQVNLRRLLDICAANGLLSWEFVGNSVKIDMPILLKLLDTDSRGARKLRSENTQPRYLERERDKERDKEEDTDRDKEVLLPKRKTDAKLANKTNTELNRKIWESYRDAYRARYGVEPIRNASVNGKIAQIGKRLGSDAIEIVAFYLGHNDQFYIKNAHSIGLCLSNAEALATQWRTGKQITSSSLRKFEKSQDQVDLLRSMKDGGF